MNIGLDKAGTGPFPTHIAICEVTGGMGLILGGKTESVGGGVKSAGGGAGITGFGGKRLLLRLHFRLRALLLVHCRKPSCLHESHVAFSSSSLFVGHGARLRASSFCHVG